MGVAEEPKTLLVIGASRGLGLAIVEQYLKRGWHAVGTARDEARTKLHELRERWNGRLEIETVDITVPAQVLALREHLRGRMLDMLFVNAGVKNDDRETIADVSTDEFVRVMLTNALSPLRVVEALQDLARPDGTIAIMSSGQGSVANNENGGYEVYRASKAALNTLIRDSPYGRPIRVAAGGFRRFWGRLCCLGTKRASFWSSLAK